TLKIGYLDFDKDILWIFRANTHLVSNILKTLVGSAFIGLVLLSFWFGYLRSKVRTNKLLIVLYAFFINLAGLYLYHIRPPYIAFFLFLPLAFVWAYYALNNNFVCTFFSVFTVQFFLELSLVGNLTQGFLSTPAILAGTFILLLFGSGSYIVTSKITSKDFEHYVPEYVSRIAERERFLKELEIARTVQLRFLPQSIPELPHLDIACVCKPAMEVGGDYYDFLPNGDGNLGIVIGDVSGKGVSAAFYMTMAKGIIKTLSKRTNNPKQILTEMNAIFYENAPKDVFISVVYGLFDREKNKLFFARAGHNPVIVRKKRSQQPELLRPNGLAIGLERGQLFSQTIEEAVIPLEPDDVYVFYTDGISEAMNKNGDEFGEDRLRNVIAENGHCSAKDLIAKTTREIMKFSGNTEQHDDITMVVVKVGSMLPTI
ncbi:MAG: PP2C family protein-serine/threonine phosphatase, partial [bacterium]